jgi:hypothetical protein
VILQIIFTLLFSLVPSEVLLVLELLVQEHFLPELPVLP